ncbi:(2Fe-2S) ferredoxin [Evansella caseinilytica]|uniref:(2Fe-2S) ferredoxin n=1 Tax=Evansella caseinilytica TaxID=1503961 RepID=A0A1H3LVG1_9BACI|nr:(2Fe-2S) ferredoxin domain-containing protein [Evansella caseinilytica]SDY68381.1 (2Fe-2S) ferredoxin [Evansella caseinilytica]
MATWNLTETRYHLLICNGSSCKQQGAEELTQAIRKEITERELDRVIHTTRTLCNGRCQDKCVLLVYPEGHWYKEMTSTDAPSLISALMEGKRMQEKISHTFTGDGLEPAPGTVLGAVKSRERVEKVSKKM